MKLIIALFFALTLLPSSTLAHDEEHALSAKDDPPGDHRIVYDGTRFEPARLEINRGERVTFVNHSDNLMWPASNIHPTHKIYPGFDTKEGIARGGSWSFVFDRPGQWRFHNHLAPTQGGLVEVHGAGETAQAEPSRDATPRNYEFKSLEPLTPEQARSLFDDDDFLKQAVETYGPGAIIDAISRSAKKTNRECHDRAHVVGRLAYHLFGSAAFTMTSMKCESGSLHGATEAMLFERGTNNIARDTKEVCSTTSSAFARNQCIHGIGHGLMAWTNYELHDALAICDQLENQRSGGSDTSWCYSGVFMENVAGGLSGSMGHVTRFLSAEDSHYPCNDLDKKYVASCYIFQTTQMKRLLSGFRDIAVACAEAPDYAQKHCYLGMGREVAGATKAGEQADLAVEYCGYIVVPERRLECIYSVERHWFWDPGEALLGLKLCQKIREPLSKERCYETLFSQATKLLGPEEMKQLCAGIEPGYHQRIPIKELFTRLLSSVNPFSASQTPKTIVSGFEGCRRPLPQADKLIAGFLD